MSDQFGVEIDWSAASRPTANVLDGTRVRLEPLDAGRHGDALYEAAHGEGSDPTMWDYLSYGPYQGDPEGFRGYLRGLSATGDPFGYAIVDQASDTPAGIVTYLRIDAANGVIEIGHIWFGAPIQRSPAATEAIYLLGRNAFDTLGYRRLEWKCNALNGRSVRAAERFGFTYEGTFRQHSVSKGRNRDTAWFAIVDGDWPPVRDGFERWLTADNFDADGRQRMTLARAREQIA